jgi:processive 1,2-diacylglycerol beta-glucosyltransferase
MLRVLFITTKIGFGHTKVSTTLADAVRSYFPASDTKISTYFDFFPQRFEKFINTVYIYGLKWFPYFFAYIYLTQKHYKGKGIDFWSKFLGRKYSQIIKAYDPNVIVITQGLACQWLGRLKKKGLINVPLVAVITDFIAHPFWICSEMDLYIVATEEMKNDLILRGINRDKISVSGIPIDTSFSQNYEKIHLIDKLKLQLDTKKVLIMGGGWGLGGIDNVLTFIGKMNFPLELLVVTGKNRKLYRMLKNKELNPLIHIYGRVDNICELMVVSDMVVTKAGGVTLSELLASGLPSIIWDIIPGQEEANADYIVRNRVGVKVNNLKEMENAIRTLMMDDNLRSEMSFRSRQLGKPNSAAEAVSQIEKILYFSFNLNNKKFDGNVSNVYEYFGYRLYAVLARILPLKFGYMLADLVGYALFKAMKDESMKRAYIMQRIHNDNINFNNALNLVCKNIQFFNRDLVDFFRSKRLNNKNIGSFVKFEGIEYLDDAINKGRGVLLVSTHMGSWEMAGAVLAIKGYPIGGVVWDVGNRMVAKMFYDLRSSHGVVTVKSSSIKDILESLKKNKILGIMLDIYGGNKGIQYKSWGYDLRLPRGPIVISQKTGAEILICVTLRNACGGYTIRFEKPDIRGTEEEVTIKFFEIIKKYIEKNPIQWHWIKYFFEPSEEK